MNSLRLCYKTFEIGNLDIHVRMLRDTLQYQDTNGAAEKLGICSAVWPLFGVVWPAGEILARHMFEYEVTGKKILEVGCGIGLASLVLNRRSANVTATDYHPDAERFLNYNTTLNKDVKIPFVRTGWNDKENSLDVYDIIIGSDLLYERDHADLLSAFIDRHAKENCDVIIIDPGRGNHASFSKKMVALNYSCTQRNPTENRAIQMPVKLKILHYSR
jgi:predicted nicotinamide N-methyase